jgi:hypothetical protein
MKRLVLSALLVLGSMPLATGCRSCESPYDYTPPVDNCQCQGCTACGAGRAGSILSGGYASEEVYDEAYGGDLAPMPTEAEVTE